MNNFIDRKNVSIKTQVDPVPNFITKLVKRQVNL